MISEAQQLILLIEKVYEAINFKKSNINLITILIYLDPPINKVINEVVF